MFKFSIIQMQSQTHIIRMYMRKNSNFEVHNISRAILNKLWYKITLSLEHKNI